MQQSLFDGKVKYFIFKKSTFNSWVKSFRSDFQPLSREKNLYEMSLPRFIQIKQ